jgi:hypothetical protein
MRYRFVGRVLPERACVSMTPSMLPSTNIIGMVCWVWVDHSVLTVDVNLPSPTMDIWTLKNAIENLVNAQVDSFGYTTSRGYGVELVSGGIEGEPPATFGVEFSALAAHPPNSSYETVARHAMSCLNLRLALADYRNAIRSPWETPFLCYRVAETVMQYFRRDGDDKAKGWEQMRSSLGLPDDYLDPLRSASIALRPWGCRTRPAK